MQSNRKSENDNHRIATRSQSGLEPAWLLPLAVSAGRRQKSTGGILPLLQNQVLRLFVAAGLTAALAAVGGCGLPRNTLNVNSASACRGPVATVTVPANMQGGNDATWTVSWIGGSQPYTVAWNFGGGAEPSTVNVPNATSPFSCNVSMLNQSLTANATYTYTCVITDAQGLTGTRTGTYSVGPMLNMGPDVPESPDDSFQPNPNWPVPVIESVILENRILRVKVGGECRHVIVKVDVPDGCGIDVPQVELESYYFRDQLETWFELFAEDRTVGAQGPLTVRVTAVSYGTQAEPYTLELNIPPAGPAGPDALLCYPLQTEAAVGEPVTIVVATTATASPFQYVNGVGVTVESAAEYVRLSFDVGAPDELPDAGGAQPVDGLWAAMQPEMGFLLAPDSFIQSQDIGRGRERWDFNLTPVFGSDQINAQGDLFNFKLTFSVAGTYRLGFQEIATVNRTYYTGADSRVRFWGDLGNYCSEHPSMLTVTE